MADNNQVIGATLKVDATSAVTASKSISEMRDNIKQLQKAFEGAASGSKEQADAFKKLKAAQDELKTSTTTLNKAQADTTGHFKNIKEGLSQTSPALNGASDGVTKLSATLKLLLANPIVLFLTAIVAVLTLIYEAFKNSFEGGEKLEQVFAGIKAAGQALLDSLAKMGSAIVKIFTFDFSGALDDIKSVGNAVADAYNKMANLTKVAQDLKREQLANDLDAAKRAKDLAILREQSTDEDVPLAKRKAALKELQAAAIQNAKEDIDLAKRTAENKIAQLTLEKDGEKKNVEEITKIKIEQIQGETENANELRRINKQVTAAEKQELAERKEQQKAAAEAAKAERQKLVEFTNKLLKLQQDNELATLKDGYDKELKTLQNRIADEKRANDLAYKDKKLNKEQQAKLDAALDIQLDVQKAAIDEKRNKDIQKKEADFQKELAGITEKTKLSGVADARRSELVALEIGYQEKLQQAIEHYKDDQAKLTQIKLALDAQLKAEQDKANEKFAKEDAKKQFDVAEQKQKAIIDAKNFDFHAKITAADAEQELVQQAFDNKVISELEYNTKVAALSEARKAIREQEAAHNQTVTSSIAGALNTLSEIAGKQTVLGKTLAIASTTISTYQAAIGAFKGMVTTIPGPVGIALGAVAAAGAIVTGLAAVKKIVSVQIPGQAGGGGATPSGITAPSAPVAPTQATTKLDANSLDKIGNASSRVYVLDSDVANNRERDERLNRAARLGG
jgi:hypothetical protein